MVNFRSLGAVAAALFALVAAGPARAGDCPGNPNAIGTSRTIYVDPTEHPRLGVMQYPETLPLADHEVVLTFDDGPLPPSTTHVLKTLDSECVKATFFLIGRMATTYPEWVRRIHEAGHTIGTHSQNHPLRFDHMTAEQIDQEVETGITSVAAALGDRKQIAPFFRIPGLLRSGTVEQYMAGKALMTWSADFPADDWLRISPSEIANRALRRIEARQGGILLLHDIKPTTALALPTILHELKKRGYRIVHVAPASAEHPKTETRTVDWIARRRHMAGTEVAWPQPSLTIEMLLAEPILSIPDRRNFDFGEPAAPVADAAKYGELPGEPAVMTSVAASDLTLPVPAKQIFGIGKSAVPIMVGAPALIQHAAGPSTLYPQAAARTKRRQVHAPHQTRTIKSRPAQSAARRSPVHVARTKSSAP